MKGISKSSSAPSIPQGTALGIVAGNRHLLESLLYVARPADSQGPAAWEPFRFTHHQDGSVSFRPAKGSSGCLPSADGCASLSSAHDECFLDADWRQPFVAAPWKPLARPDLPDKDKSGGELFPFTLSYAPARPVPGDSDSAVSRRRTVVLAAHSAKARSKWLDTLAGKARSPELRSNAPTSPPTKASPPSVRRRIGTLGQEHCGVPLGLTGKGTTSMPRLATGPAGLWDSHSQFRIVRDLYDSYAADPLANSPVGQRKASVDSDSSSASVPSKTPKSKFLGRYLERQAEIEKLLDHTWTGGRPDNGNGTDPDPAEPSSPDLGARAMSPGDAATCVGHVAGTSDWGALFCRYQLADKTSNVTLEGDLLSNSRWSGGAIFSPPNERSFRLTISLLDAMDEHPVYLGLAPANADLSMVSFYSSGGGVFMCIGGRASEDPIAALGAPGGPAFFCMGGRSEARLPNPRPGQSISVHYSESDGGEVRFIVSTEDGIEIRSDKPPLEEGLPLGPWRPCVLMCMPETRVRIVRLI